MKYKDVAWGKFCESFLHEAQTTLLLTKITNITKIPKKTNSQNSQNLFYLFSSNIRRISIKI